MEKETIIASFVYTIFFSQTNGFSVSTFKEKKGKNIKCVGSNLPSYKNIDYELTGSWEKDKRGEMQFKVDSFSEHVEKEKDSIITFLSSGAIKGIGKKTAERIFEMYGLESLDVLEHRPENLLRVRGITESKLKKIIESYSENHLPKDLIELLLPCGFTTKDVLKIYKKYRSDYMNTIIDDPYQLAEISGITFTLCDRLGRQLKIEGTDRRRLHCAVYESLKESFFCGKVGATPEELIKRVAEKTGFKDKDFIYRCIKLMAKSGLISYKKVLLAGKGVIYFYLNEIKEAETNLALEIVRSIEKINLRNKALSLLNKNNEITFDDTQKKAILDAFTYRISIITGGPGTGKTTITKKIAQIEKEISGEEPVLLAPTGKAARRITESTGIPAYTIHSYLHLRVSQDEEYAENYDEDEIIENRLVIIDEFSMVDMKLALTLFEHMKNCRIVIIGDPNQLQSVGAGNVLLDMIDCGKLPVTKLVYEHRQGEGSTINKNSNAMQNGATEFENADDFYCEYISGDGSDDTLKKIEDKAVREYLKYLKTPGINSVLCLCPYRNYTAGMFSINKRLQDEINPLKPGSIEFNGHHGMVFRIGDPIMHVEKNLEEVSNGNTGIVKDIKKVDNELTLFAEYDLGTNIVNVEYTASNIDQLSLAYAITVHKSQGSEYDAIVTLLSSFHKTMIKRRIPYTAITRAKKSVSIIIDKPETLKSAIQNNSTDERNTLLGYLIREQLIEKEALKREAEMSEPREIKSKNNTMEGQLELIFS